MGMQISYWMFSLNLSAKQGADLDDPHELLEGGGKLLRHIKMRSLADIEHEGIRPLITAASNHLPKLKN